MCFRIERFHTKSLERVIQEAIVMRLIDQNPYKINMNGKAEYWRTLVPNDKKKEPTEDEIKEENELDARIESLRQEFVENKKEEYAQRKEGNKKQRKKGKENNDIEKIDTKSKRYEKENEKESENEERNEMEKKSTVENKSVDKEDPEPQNSQICLEKRNLI